MALITKPDMEFIWASGGAVVKPSDVKIQTGWTPEVPPHQWENWAQNRQDQYIAHVNQRGIPQWDGNTEYEAAGLSYVQGTDGVIYKSVAASGPATTVQDPTTDIADTYWTVAFASTTQATETVQGIVELATTAEAEAGLDDERAMTPLKVKQAIAEFAGYALPLNYFSGLTLTNNVGAPNTTIDVGAGTARSSDNTVDVTLTGTLSGILQTSGAWAAGNNQNKLDTGARANNTWYHVFAIRKTSDGTGDILFSLSPTAPTMPSGYAGFVLIESVLTDGSGNILGFINVGNRMTWKTAAQDVAQAGVNFGNSTITISTPLGRRVKVRQYGMVYSNAPCIYTHSPEVNNESMGYPGFGWTIGVSTNNPAINEESIAGYLECETNLLSQVVLQTFTTINPITALRLTTVGWEK